MTYDSEELDSVVDEFRERMVLAREAMAEFAQPEPPLLCALCEQYIDYGDVCPKCDMWRDGLYGENAFTYDEDVRNG